MSPSNRSSIGVLLAAVVALCLVAPLGAQQPAKPQTPTFKATADFVPVDVSVVDKEGRPVPALQASDFEVSVDGKPRRVMSVEFMSTERDVKRVPAAPGAAGTAPERSASSNETAPVGRLYAIVVDVGNIQPGGVRAATEAAIKFIRTLNPEDRVAFFSIPVGPSVDFTADHQRVIEQLGKVTGAQGESLRGVVSHVSPSDAVELQAGPGFSCGDPNIPPHFERLLELNGCGMSREREARIACCQTVIAEVQMLVTKLQQATGQTLAALDSLVTGLARVEGPKTLVLISQRLINGRSGSLDNTAQLRFIGEQAAAARVTLYVLHVSRGFIDQVGIDTRMPSASPFQDDDVAREGLEILAGASRGALFSVVSGADRAFERIERETTAYYLLGIEAADGDRDGKRHSIRVRLAQKRGYEIRSRSEFVIRKAAVVSPMQRLGEMLRAPFSTRGLPVRVATRVLPGPTPDKVQMVIAGDIGREGTPPDVAVGFVVRDKNGRPLANSAERRRLEPKQRPDGTVGLRYVAIVQVPPGHYRLKLAAVDEGGDGGSVEHEVESAVTPAGPFFLGDIVLGESREATLSQGLSLDDTVSGSQARAYIQMAMKDGGFTGQLTVTADVADTPTGRALLTSPLPLGRTEAGLLVADGPMDLRLLPPGDYYARATVTVSGQVVGTRTTPFKLVAAAAGAGGAAAGAAAASPRAPGATLAIGADRLLVRPFDRRDLLRTDVVAYFVDRLAVASPAATEAVSAARAAARAGQVDAARDRLAGADENLLDVRFLRGLALYGAGSLEPAATEFRAALKLDSQFLPAAFYLGACYAAGGNDREAVGAWQMALVSESDARIVYEVLVDALLRLREGEQAADFMREAVERWQADETLQPRRAAVAAATGDAAAALQVLEPYLEAHPDDATSLFLAMRVIYQARADGKTVRGAAEDAKQMAKYAGLYQAAGGPEREIVARWLAFVEGKK